MTLKNVHKICENSLQIDFCINLKRNELVQTRKTLDSKIKFQ